MSTIILVHNDELIDVRHEASKQAKRQFANHKMLQPQKVNAGLYSLHEMVMQFYEGTHKY